MLIEAGVLVLVLVSVLVLVKANRDLRAIERKTGRRMR